MTKQSPKPYSETNESPGRKLIGFAIDEIFSVYAQKMPESGKACLCQLLVILENPHMLAEITNADLEAISEYQPIKINGASFFDIGACKGAAWILQLVKESPELSEEVLAAVKQGIDLFDTKWIILKKAEAINREKEVQEVLAAVEAAAAKARKN